MDCHQSGNGFRHAVEEGYLMTGKNGNYRENPVFPFRGQKAVDSGKRYWLRSPWSVPNFPANCAEALLPIKQPTNGSLQQGRIARGLPHREATWCGRGERRCVQLWYVWLAVLSGKWLSGVTLPEKAILSRSSCTMRMEISFAKLELLPKFSNRNTTRHGRHVLN
jgi:hypothetical protein